MPHVLVSILPGECIVLKHVYKNQNIWPQHHVQIVTDEHDTKSSIQTKNLKRDAAKYLEQHLTVKCM